MNIMKGLVLTLYGLSNLGGATRNKQTVDSRNYIYPGLGQMQISCASENTPEYRIPYIPQYSTTAALQTGEITPFDTTKIPRKYCPFLNIENESEYSGDYPEAYDIKTSNWDMMKRKTDRLLDHDSYEFKIGDSDLKASISKNLFYYCADLFRKVNGIERPQPTCTEDSQPIHNEKSMYDLAKEYLFKTYKYYNEPKPDERLTRKDQMVEDARIAQEVLFPTVNHIQQQLLSSVKNRCAHAAALLEQAKREAFRLGKKIDWHFSINGDASPTSAVGARGSITNTNYKDNQYSISLDYNSIFNVSPNTLLFVIAHELSHGLYNFKKLTKNGRRGPEFEAETDYLALYLLSNAGYPPENFRDVWKEISPTELYDDQGIKYYSHPPTRTRHLLMQKTIEEIRAKEYLKGTGQIDHLTPNRIAKCKPKNKLKKNTTKSISKNQCKNKRKFKFGH